MYCTNCGHRNNDQAIFCASCGVALQPVKEKPIIQEDSSTTTTMQYANFGKRFGATIIDGTLAIIFSGILWLLYNLLLAVLTGLNPFTEHGDEWMGRLGVIVILILNIAYLSVIECSSLQATLGKLMVGIIVTDLEGNRISFWRSVIRVISKLISAVPNGILLLISCFTIVLTQEKKALHDMIAGTRVIMKS